MDTPEDTVPVTPRLFGSKTAPLAAVENTQVELADEVAQDEAMTAEAEETPVAVIDTPVVAAEPAESVEQIAAENADVRAEIERIETPVSLAEAIAEVETQNAAVESLTGLSGETEVEETTVGEVNVAEPIDEAEAVNETMDALAVPAVELPVEAEAQSTDEVIDAPVDASEVVIEAPAAKSGRSVEELRSEREALDREITEKQNAQKVVVLDQIKTVCETYGISADEVAEAMGGLKNKRKGVPAKPKYKDPATGVIWSGRGKAPAWIKGKPFDQFLITE